MKALPPTAAHSVAPQPERVDDPWFCAMRLAISEFESVAADPKAQWSDWIDCDQRKGQFGLQNFVFANLINVLSLMTSL